jgi:glycosyltransferase involved in cell wall biosynthesis
MLKIPKIIHQIWIGPKPTPQKMMNTWKDKHPDFEYIFWNESEFTKRCMTFACQPQIDKIGEIVGKVDMMRIEILYKYGGIYVDADSICIEPLDQYFLCKRAFATFENENVRAGLVATGTMGFVPNYPLCKDMIEWFQSDDAANKMRSFKAWYSVGPGCLTRFLNTGKYTDFSVFPSHCFLPVHFTGLTYSGHKKIYAYQEWGNTKQNYDMIEHVVLPSEFSEPSLLVSVLITSFNTPLEYLKDCLNSIKNQEGYFGMEIVWINDGSNEHLSTILVDLLEEFQKSTRFCRVVYKKMETNRGLTYCLHEGVKMCSNELIFRMDSDDIMVATRIQKQLEFMAARPDCMICGGNIRMFRTPSTELSRFNTEYFANVTHSGSTTSLLRNATLRPLFTGQTNHPEVITWPDFLKNRPDWFANHPTLCFKKSAVLAVGNYNIERPDYPILEDYELELKMIKRYGSLYNIPDVLVYYRLHNDQLTYKTNSHSAESVLLRDSIILEISGYGNRE